MPLQTLTRRWARLRSMSADELQDRLRQQVSARADALRYYAGLGFRADVRSSGSGAFFFDSSQVPAICDILKRRMPDQIAATVKRAEKICEHRFDLLGHSGLDYGADIDWHFDAVNGKRAPFKPFHRIHYLDFHEVGDAKVTWELNRHQHLVTLAKTYRFTGEPKFSAELFRQWKDWWEKNPYPMGINWASSLEVAFRSLSWLWIYFLLSGSAEVPPPWFEEQWTKALAISGRHIERYLSTYFSPNTHLLGEGVALFFIGTLCPRLKSAARWKERGWRIVLDEARRQVRADGMHFEQSLYYHVYALDFFLHARILAVRNEMKIPADFDEKLRKMLEALALLAATGAPPSFGDDDGGRLFDPQRNRTQHLLDPLATGAVLFQRGDFKNLAGDVREETIWLLGGDAIKAFDELPPLTPRLESAALPDSGLYIMADPESRTQLIIDAGPQGTETAGHGHADALSVWASKAGEPLLIDKGTCVYVGEGQERNQFRGTSAHSTLRVDNVDQAIPSGSFAWTNQPTTIVDDWISGKTFDYFAGHHDGYARLEPPVMHQREVFARKGLLWVIRDTVEGTGSHDFEVAWHLPPGFREAGNFFASDAEYGIGILAAGQKWKRVVEEECWSPAYGRKEGAPVLRYRARTNAPAELLTMLLPGISSADEIGAISSVDAALGVSAYKYRSGREEYHLVFARGGQEWVAGPCASDARFLYYGTRQDGRCELIVCHGRHVVLWGKPIVSCGEPVQRLELIELNGRREMH